MWGGSFWGKTYYGGEYWGPAVAEPPPPPSPTPGGGSSGGGGFGWIATEEEWLGLKRLRGLLSERREEDKGHLRDALKRAYFGESEGLTETIAEIVSPVVDLTVDDIDWEPALDWDELTTRLESRVGMMLDAAEIRLARQARMEREAAERADEEDIELLLLTIN